MFDIVDAIVTIREMRNIKQATIAEMLNITRSALNQFEKKKAKISRENILALCEVLNINKNYFESFDESFLESNDVLYLKAKHRDHLYKFMLYAKNVDYLCVFVPDTVIKYYYTRFVGETLFIVIVRFKNNTLCVLDVNNLVKSINDFAVHFESMFEKLKLANIKASYTVIEQFDNKKEILNKIKQKTITKKEILILFEKAEVANVNLSLSVEEKQLLVYMRNNNISALDVLEKIKNETNASKNDTQKSWDLT